MNRNRQHAERATSFARVVTPALQAVLIGALCMLMQRATPVQAQSYWEMTPYRIELLIAIDPAVAPCSQLAQDLPAAVLERADNLVGPIWQAHAQVPPPVVAHRLLSRFDQLTLNDLGKLPEDLDKVLILAISADPNGFLVRARDYDLRTITWSTPAEAHVSHLTLLADAAFDTVWKAFAPIAQIDVDGKHNIFLRPRAGGLPLRDPTLHLAAPGDLFRPVIRRLDRQGRTAEGGVQTVPWTFLTVEAVNGVQASCKAHSGLRQALGTRRRGQSEHLAIAVRPTGGSTLLKIVGRGEPPQLLPGYDVYAQIPGDKATTHVGRSNSLGEVVIPSVPENPVRILYVKGGSILLARLPMVPGLDPELTAAVADDDARLAIDGYLASMRDNIVDLVARREIAMARIRNRMESKKFDEAEKLFDELRRLPTREQLTLAINEQKTRNASPDPAVQAKIDRAVAEAQKSIHRFLDPRPLDALRTELNQAQQSQ